MKKIKRLFSLMVCLLGIITLASCSSSKVNQEVPYGTIDNSVYASISNASITNRELYDYLRKDALSVVYQDMKEKLFADVIALCDYENDADDKEKINETIISEIYGVSTVDAYKKLTEDSKRVSIEKYIDQRFKEGKIVTESQLQVSIETIDGEEVFVATFPEVLVKDKAYSIGLEKYAKAEIKKIYNEKYVDGKKNKFYISEDDIRGYYHNYGKKYNTSQAIVIKFLSQAQAEKIMNEVLGKSYIDLNQSQEDIIQDYINIYNAQYVYREKLNAEDYLESSYVNFIVNNEKNELSALSSQFEDVFLKMEDNQAFSKARNLDGSFYLVYRINSPEIIEWEELEAGDEAVFEQKKEETLGYLIDSKNTSTYQSELVSDRYDEIYDANALEIYDPVIAALYNASYSDYELANKFNKNLVYSFTYNDVEYSMTPEELFEKMEKLYGMDTAIGYLVNEYAMSNSVLVAKIESDTISDYTDELDSDIKSFKKGKTSYSKKIGLSAYLTLKYGFSTRALVLEKYYLASNARTELYSYFGSHTTDGVNFDKDDKLFTNLMNITQKIYEESFTTKISHILISVDDEGNGEAVNPELYIQNLPNESKRDEFKRALLELSQAIISEAKILSLSLTYSEALQYIVTAYNNGYKVPSQGNVTWDSYKKFNFTLKFEDLGEITYITSANYVSQFADEVKNLYNRFKDDDASIKDKGYLQFTSTGESIDSIEDLCTTTYGYHILNIYSVAQPKSSQFLPSSDSQSDEDGQYLEYEHLKIVIEPDNDDDDEEPQRYLYANSYSDFDYPSTNQLFIYFYETLNGGVKSIKSSKQTAIGNVFSGVYSRYVSNNFQNYRVFTMLPELHFANDDANDSKLKNYIHILERTIDNYNINDNYMYEGWFDGTFDWSVVLPS